MKKFVGLALLLLFASTITIHASEVAEAAKKEKARRAALEKSKPAAKVFTNQDVANLKSSLSFESSEAEPVPDVKQGVVATLPAVDNTVESPAEPEETQTTAANEEEERLKAEREELERQAQDAQAVINQGGGYHTRNIGNQFKAKREAESRIRQIDQELAEKEKDKEEEDKDQR